MQSKTSDSISLMTSISPHWSGFDFAIYASEKPDNNDADNIFVKVGVDRSRINDGFFILFDDDMTTEGNVFLDDKKLKDLKGWLKSNIEAFTLYWEKEIEFDEFLSMLSRFQG